MQIQDLLRLTVSRDGSDLHLAAGIVPRIRRNGELIFLENMPVLDSDMIKELLFPMITPDQRKKFETEMELDFSYHIEGLCRFRVNLHWEKKGLSAVMRVIPSQIPSPADIDLPEEVVNLVNLKNGLILVTGPTGTGKSTTLAALIEKVNIEKSFHILTVEDPIEFVYTDKKSMVIQREVGIHTKSFSESLKRAMRQDPDVVLIGEMRDLETIAASLTIAETGHLAFATLHTNDASQTIDRIIDVFPPNQQEQIRTVLAATLRAVICQQLIPRKDGTGRIVAREILFCDNALSNIIREGKTPQIYSSIQTGGARGMKTMELDLKKLLEKDLITMDAALKTANRPDVLRELCRNLKTEQNTSASESSIKFDFS
jgi:twitching motility protein PilT